MYCTPRKIIAKQRICNLTVNFGELSMDEGQQIQKKMTNAYQMMQPSYGRALHAE